MGVDAVQVVQHVEVVRLVCRCRRDRRAGVPDVAPPIVFHSANFNYTHLGGIEVAGD